MFYSLPVLRFLRFTVMFCSYRVQKYDSTFGRLDVQINPRTINSEGAPSLNQAPACGEPAHCEVAVVSLGSYDL